MLTNRQLFLQHVGQTSDQPLMLEIERAEGIYMYDNHGQQYIDLISGVSVNNIGHRHPAVIEAVERQMEKYMHLMVYGEMVQSPQVKLAKYLTDLLPASLDAVYFVNSGSEAIEGALKLAKRVTGRPHIKAFQHAYHGSTQGALSILGDEEMKNAFRPLLPGIEKLEFNNFSSLESIDRNTACVVVEPIQAEAGIIEPQNDFLQALRKRCDQVGALLIFDEVQTGLGRTGKLFAFEHYEVVPDIITLAKGLGGGMPIGAFVAPKTIMDTLKTNPMLGHITTFGGHPISCAASLASIKVIHEEHLAQKAEVKGQRFREKLQHRAIHHIRGKGLFLAIELNDNALLKRFMEAAFEEHLIMDWFLFSDTAFRIAPPLIIDNYQIDEIVKKILTALDRAETA
ncbi:MAG: aspartate aminotransferase family protein [Bacteroidales bacterium]